MFDTFIPLLPTKNKTPNTQTFFNYHLPGLLSSREYWVYNFSKSNLEQNVTNLIDFYNSEIIRTEGDISMINTDSKKISWTVNLKKDLRNRKKIKVSQDYRNAILRPFIKQNVYYNSDLIERPGLFYEVLPENKDNVIICVSGKGANKKNCIYITSKLIDYNAIDAGAKCFPLYYYEKKETGQNSLFDDTGESKYIRRDGVSDFILKRAIENYGKVFQKKIFSIMYMESYTVLITEKPLKMT